jgi:hypothetical protein
VTGGHRRGRRPTNPDSHRHSKHSRRKELRACTGVSPRRYLRSTESSSRLTISTTIARPRGEPVPRLRPSGCHPAVMGLPELPRLLRPRISRHRASSRSSRHSKRPAGGEHTTNMVAVDSRPRVRPDHCWGRAGVWVRLRHAAQQPARRVGHRARRPVTRRPLSEQDALTRSTPTVSLAVGAAGATRLRTALTTCWPRSRRRPDPRLRCPGRASIPRRT